MIHLKAPLDALAAMAHTSLEANVASLAGRCYLSAGGHQFRSLWTRHFGHAIPGLLRAGRRDVVRDHLELLFGHVRSDGLLPRTFDSSDAKLRVAWASAARLLPFARGDLNLKESLAPEYRDQHGQVAFDGNALAVIGAERYRDATGDEAWWAKHLPVLERIHTFYAPYLRDGLLHQPPFSDWQDSVRRAGPTLYSNLLYWRACLALGYDRTARTLAKRLEEAFRPRGRGLYRSLADGEWVSIDGNLLAIDLGLVTGDAAHALHDALLASDFWRRHGTPGFVTAPDYPRRWRSPTVRVAGLGHYHDRLRWSWITAMAAKTAAQVGDRGSARLALETLAGWAARDGAIAEVYAEEPPHHPWRSLLYESERPFSWGAAATLDALSEYSRRRP